MLVVGFQGFEQARQFVGAEPGVYRRDFQSQFVLIAVRQAARHIHFVHDSRRLGFGVAQDGVDGLLLGPVDEAAGVDDHDLRVVFFRLVRHVVAIAFQLGEKHFRVHQVLGTTQRDDVDFIGTYSFGFHGFVWNASPVRSD